MPHGVIAAITPFLPLIEKLLPLIEKFIDMLFNSASNYNNGTETKEDFLKNANETLKDLQKEAAENDVIGDEFTFPDSINSADECKEVANTLQKLIDDGKVDPKNVSKYEELIKAFQKAETDFRDKGVIQDPDAQSGTGGGLLQMGSGQFFA
jgi:hypothetical protein